MKELTFEEVIMWLSANTKDFLHWELEILCKIVDKADPKFIERRFSEDRSYGVVKLTSLADVQRFNELKELMYGPITR